MGTTVGTTVNKLIVAAIAGLTSLGAVLPGGITGTEWVVVAMAVLGPLAVWRVPYLRSPKTR